MILMLRVSHAFSHFSFTLDKKEWATRVPRSFTTNKWNMASHVERQNQQMEKRPPKYNSKWKSPQHNNLQVHEQSFLPCSAEFGVVQTFEAPGWMAFAEKEETKTQKLQNQKSKGKPLGPQRQKKKERGKTKEATRKLEKLHRETNRLSGNTPSVESWPQHCDLRL